MKRRLIALILLLAGLLQAGVEDDHLKVYASFDRNAEPEIALDGTKLRSAGKLFFVEGKSGKALRFDPESGVEDLMYNLGPALSGPEWTLAFWFKLDRPGNAFRSGKGSVRGLFRTNQGWKNGNLFATFDLWGKFQVTQFDGDQKEAGLSMPSSGFAAGEWIHLAVTGKEGKITLLLNGNEVVPARNRDLSTPAPKQTTLRLGSMDFRSRDQMGGDLDELKIFDKALTSDEVKEIMETVPGKEKAAKTVFYAGFDGAADARGAASFSSAELLFPAGVVKEGVKVVRHGYDRRGILSYQGIKGLGGRAATVGFTFIPDWNGASDPATHGLFFIRAGGLNYRLLKEKDQLLFILEAGDKRAEAALPAALLKAKKPAEITAGFDFAAHRLFLTVDGKEAASPLNFAQPAGETAGSLAIGDIPEGDTYSLTQAEGVIDELLVVDAAVSPAEIAALLVTAQKSFAAAHAGLLAPRPAREKEKAFWSLDGAEKVTTPTRERITLNALWRFQVTDADHPFDPAKWMYLSVPGRYSGQANGNTDCEFFLRDGNFKPQPSDTQLYGKSPHAFVNGWFERSFFADPAWKGREIVLLLNEISLSQKAIVYLNGKALSSLPIGRFFELPLAEEQLKFGEENYLTIHAVDNGQYWSWRGIRGDTALLVKPKVTAEYPFISTSVKEGTVRFEVTLRNRSAKPVRVRPEAEIAGVKTFTGESLQLLPHEEKIVTFSAPWPNARLWTPDDPHLYTADFRLREEGGKLLDEAEAVRFGFREFEIRGRDYYLNGNKLHLFTDDSWRGSSSDLEEARKTIRTLKALGYNSIRSLFPDKDSYPDNIMRVCDEEGMLQFVGLGGVTGREYPFWNDPKVRENLEAKMAGMIRRWRNSPSIGMYFLSINFLGYGWDYHPLKMADGYLPDFKKKQAAVSFEGAEIMKKYDPTRPWFFQAGGNFGPVITNNAYFCWWPQAERNAWPEVWSRIGEKPLHIIETSFPYHKSFYGMDLRYSGAKSLFFYENLARYYGPEVYLDRDKEILSETLRAAGGKPARLWYDAPMHQKLRSDLIRETIRNWRAFDLSGICPFEEINSAFRKNAPPRTEHISKVYKEINVNEFRRFGWSPDLRKQPYQHDLNYAEPLPVADALRDALEPKTTFFSGTPSPADRRHHYAGGERLVKSLTMINDTAKAEIFRAEWKLLDAKGKTIASGKVEHKVEPGEIFRAPVEAVLPEVTERTPYRLVSGKETLELTVYPKAAAKAEGVALYDPKGFTGKDLQALGLAFADAAKLESLQNLRLLVIGREGLTPEFQALARKWKLAEAVNRGRLNLLILEQQPEAIALLGLETKAIYARNAFPGTGTGFLAEDFRDWAGDGTIAPAHQPPAPTTQEGVASPLWHWSNRNLVASYPIRRPVEGDYRILLATGKDLLYTPLFELKSGAGRILVSQLDISGRSEADPAALAALARLVTEYARPNPLIKRAPWFFECTDETLAAVREGATLVAPPGSFERFGLTAKPVEANWFAITEAGRQYWPELTARDEFLRTPQKLAALSGPGLIPLTEPAFAAELPYGKGRILFLETPAKPQQKERERGLKQGADSSLLWSAQILNERFLQLRNRLAALGGKTASFAERFEAMREGERLFDLAGEWEFQVEGGKVAKAAVPGYYNHQFPELANHTGVVFYRKRVQLPKDFTGKELILDLGAVDDYDKTCVNGVEVGRTGEETPGYWSARRRYPVPARLTAKGTLDIEIRVENPRGKGGVMGHARLALPAPPASPYPYTGLDATYDTETHIRW